MNDLGARIVAEIRHRQTALSVAVLALLAYVPALTAAPGRMPADSKLYVYLDPGRFIADTVTTFDPRQFAGWVPHQHIAYLWPTGPWFWTFEQLGVPDWVAHRLWIGTLLFAAGLGARWVARVLGFSALAALTAALVYQLSPYVLPYISRTSVLLLPYAALGWIVGLTILAGRRGGWRYPALIALVVFTVSAVNATAVAMIIPAPVLWLVHAVWSRDIDFRRAIGVAVRTAVLCIGVSLWWIVMLIIQGRNGAEVLAYSESLESVSFTSTSTEVARGLGYWLFYVRDAYAATTTASVDHMTSGITMLAGYLVIAAGLVGLALVTGWKDRRFAGLLFGAGVVLGVGVHPIADPSPLMSLLVADEEAGLALALRSSTRAVPMVLLGLGLGAAAFVTRVGAWVPRCSPRLARVSAAVAIGLLAVIALPALRTGGFVDPALERDQEPPTAWLEAAADLDARPDGFRVLQLPGTEFGAFQWGYTVDQPLPALTERPLVTRDLLPLGSPAAMDLVFALDDRIQSDTIEPAAIAAVSRFLGVDTIWVSGDVAYDRFRLARPEVVTDELTSPAAIDAGLVDAQSFGEPAMMGSVVPMIDNRTLGDPRVGKPIAPVSLVSVEDPVPTVRVKDDVVVLAGSGDGVVDASAAGVLDGSEAVLYDASITESTPLDSAYRYVITDSNRDRAHHWRSSQDVWGFTESADDASDVLRFESADARLPVFDESESADQTVSVQVGPVSATASAYGEPFAYLPEHRPVMAIDGDRSTSWLVGDRGDPIGEFIVLDSPTADIDHVVLRQPDASDDARRISNVAIVSAEGARSEHALDPSSWSGDGQRIDLESPTGSVTIEITSTTTAGPLVGEGVGGVGFAEIDVGLDATTEYIRTPTDPDGRSADATSLDIVLTRLRTEPADRWRSDPEPTLRRVVDLREGGAFDASVTLRLDRRLEGRPLADLLGESAWASDHLTGVPAARGAAAVDGDPATSWVTPFDDVVGQFLQLQGSGTADELTIVQPGGDHSPITGLRLVFPGGNLDVALPPDDDAVIELPRSIDLADLRLEITAIDQRVSADRRFAESTVLPAAISEIEIDGDPLAITPVERLAAECSTDFVSVDGVGLPITFDVATTDAMAGAPIDGEPCSGPVQLAAGTVEVAAIDGYTTGFDVDRLLLRGETTGDPLDQNGVDPTDTVVESEQTHARTIEVPTCPDGCWVVVGEGFNPAWHAELDGDDLGTPTLIDGNANGWWIEPRDEPGVVEVTWTAQRPLDIALMASGLAVMLCGWLALRRVRGCAVPDDRPVVVGAGRFVRRQSLIPAVLCGFMAAIFIDWIWLAPALLVWALAVVVTPTRAPQLVGLLGAGAVVYVGFAVIAVSRNEQLGASAGWPARFEAFHPWTLLGVILLVSSVLMSPTTSSRRSLVDDR